MTIRRNDQRLWFEGPRFDYIDSRKKISVNVCGSSWTIKGLAKAEAVRRVLGEKFGVDRVLDFGAGSWLRYVDYLRDTLPSSDVYAVEFDEAFHDDSMQLKLQFQPDVTFWTPDFFLKNLKKLKKGKKFDLILLINVLNTMPEEEHRRAVFACLSQLLNPLGWLVVYQRIWAVTDNPKTGGAVEYGGGWFIPQEDYGYYTYRATTGARWFNAIAAQCGLKSVDIETKITSRNTLLRVWEIPFGGKQAKSR